LDGLIHFSRFHGPNPRFTLELAPTGYPLAFFNHGHIGPLFIATKKDTLDDISAAHADQDTADDGENWNQPTTAAAKQVTGFEGS
jgi:hypothetical protein